MLTSFARAVGARIIEPIARLLARLGMTPNSVTVLGLLLTMGVAIVLATGRTQLAGILLILTLGFDAVDGTMARLSGSASSFGGFLDSTLDRWAEIAIYLALIWNYTKLGVVEGIMLSSVAMATSLMVSYTRARAEGAGFPIKEGVLTRFERLVILVIGLVSDLIIPALWIISILAGLTAVQRIWAAKRFETAASES